MFPSNSLRSTLRFSSQPSWTLSQQYTQEGFVDTGYSLLLIRLKEKTCTKISHFIFCAAGQPDDPRRRLNFFFFSHIFFFLPFQISIKVENCAITEKRRYKCVERTRLFLSIAVLVPDIVTGLWIYNTPLEWPSWVTTGANPTYKTAKYVTLATKAVASKWTLHQADDVTKLLIVFVKSDQNLLFLPLITDIPLCLHPGYSSWLFIFIIFIILWLIIFIIIIFIILYSHTDSFFFHYLHE